MWSTTIVLHSSDWVIVWCTIILTLHIVNPNPNIERRYESRVRLRKVPRPPPERMHVPPIIFMIWHRKNAARLRCSSFFWVGPSLDSLWIVGLSLFLKSFESSIAPSRSYRNFPCLAAA
jgi:hypothetical protein